MFNNPYSNTPHAPQRGKKREKNHSVCNLSPFFFFSFYLRSNSDIGFSAPENNVFTMSLFSSFYQSNTNSKMSLYRSIHRFLDFLKLLVYIVMVQHRLILSDGVKRVKNDVDPSQPPLNMGVAS